jgi:predicted ATPase with chaperone activity
VTVGGELTLEMLDLSFNPIAKFYEAPLQMKANGGVFVVDDFGRQRISPRDLLNRWIVPLESRVDFLTLHTGKKFEMPFDVLIIFATNLNPESLADEAFLRRIPYKILREESDHRRVRPDLRAQLQAQGRAYDPVIIEYLAAALLRAARPRHARPAIRATFSSRWWTSAAIRTSRS